MRFNGNNSKVLTFNQFVGNEDFSIIFKVKVNVDAKPWVDMEKISEIQKDVNYIQDTKIQA